MGKLSKAERLSGEMQQMSEVATQLGLSLDTLSDLFSKELTRAVHNKIRQEEQHLLFGFPMEPGDPGRPQGVIWADQEPIEHVNCRCQEQPEGPVIQLAKRADGRWAAPLALPAKPPRRNNR